jgi:hypothetical protein
VLQLTKTTFTMNLSLLGAAPAASARPAAFSLVAAMMMMVVVMITGVSSASQGLQYGDRWNYDTTLMRSDGFVDYGPSEWNMISCDESTPEGLDACLAYRDKWHTAQDWKIGKKIF